MINFEGYAETLNCFVKLICLLSETTGNLMLCFFATSNTLLLSFCVCEKSALTEIKIISPLSFKTEYNSFNSGTSAIQGGQLEYQKSINMYFAFIIFSCEMLLRIKFHFCGN